MTIVFNWGFRHCFIKCILKTSFVEFLIEFLGNLSLAGLKSSAELFIRLRSKYTTRRQRYESTIRTNTSLSNPRPSQLATLCTIFRELECFSKNTSSRANLSCSYRSLLLWGNKRRRELSGIYRESSLCVILPNRKMGNANCFHNINRSGDINIVFVIFSPSSASLHR